MYYGYHVGQSITNSQRLAFLFLFSIFVTFDLSKQRHVLSLVNEVNCFR